MSVETGDTIAHGSDAIIVRKDLRVTCDTEVGRELTAALIAQVTPFYIVTVVALVALGTVAVESYRGRFTLPPVTRAIVVASLVGILCYGLWRYGYDRAYIAKLTEMTCRTATPQR